MIAILCGGCSYEHEISIISALALKKRFKDYLLLYLNIDNELFYIKKANMNNIIKQKGKKISFTQKGLKSIDVDFIILTCHGYGVEDSIGSILEFIHMPYLGSGVYPGVIAMDKWFSYITLNSLGVMQPKKQRYKPYYKVELDYPLIVKPRKSGSSLGISVCHSEEELIKSSIKALKYDKDLIVEEYLNNMIELSAAFYDDGSIKVSKVEKINHNEEFFDFNEKYLSHDKLFKHEFIEDESLTKRIYDIGSLIYKYIGAKDIIRIDFFLLNDIIYVNEINTIPGSLSCYMFDDFENIITRLINKNKREFYLNKQIKSNGLNLDILKYNNKMK